MTRRVRRAFASLLVLIVACGSSSDASDASGSGGSAGTPPPGSTPPGGTSGGTSGTPPGAVPPPTPGAPMTPAQIATKLRGKAQFLIGMGNDLASDHSQDGAYTLGTTLDLHYAYMVGLQGQGGWPDWDANGSFVNILSDSADKKGVTPMYTLYSMRAWGEANLDVLTNDGFMTPYWSGAKLLFQRIKDFGKPAVVHVEPDFWGFSMQKAPGADHPVHVKALVPECSALNDDLGGFVRCMIILGRTYAPNAVIGFHASVWGGDAQTTVAYFKKLGVDGADFVSTDMLDRDAGCFELHTDPNCTRGGTTGWYWDETNATSPNFHEHLAWAKGIHDGLGLPLMWWQIPFGVPSATPGGTAGHYRDNRVHYLFNHVDEYVAAGGFAAAFGTGAGNQTYITTDGGQFKNAVTAYYAKPFELK
jgi:hypothetical protein